MPALARLPGSISLHATAVHADPGLYLHRYETPHPGPCSTCIRIMHTHLHQQPLSGFLLAIYQAHNITAEVCIKDAKASHRCELQQPCIVRVASFLLHQHGQLLPMYHHTSVQRCSDYSR